MGCATSAERGLRRRKSPFSPVRRSSATHVHHVPSLSSSTVGSIKMTHLASNVENLDLDRTRKIVPRTPIRTPPGEPETINAWELMEGLEEGDDAGPASPGHCRGFSYNLPLPPETAGILGSGEGKKPAWLRTPDSEFGVSGFPMAPETPEVPDAGKNPVRPRAADSKFGASGFSPEKSPQAPKTPDIPDAGKKGSKFGVSGFSPENSPPATETPDIPGGGQKPASLRSAGSKFRVLGFSPETSPPAPELTVVVYFTSLRGVRRTYEDCRDVRRILRSIGVKVDERDVSMDSGFRDELRGLAGAGALPGVFVGGEYVGGAEEIRRLHEDGGLERVFDHCERVGGGGGACGGCGGVRFVPCEDCSGSCKIYCDGGGGEGEAEECGFQRCRRCNENGLVRCPLCCCY